MSAPLAAARPMSQALLNAIPVAPPLTVPAIPGMGNYLVGILKEGAVDVDVIFGEQINYTAESNRKIVSRQIEKRMRDMLSLKLRGR